LHRSRYRILALGLMLLNYTFGTLLNTMVGNVVPAYRTFKALQIDSEMEPSDEPSRWLKYWVVFGIFAAVEYFIDLVGAWVPMYYECKLSLLLWLSLDKWKGASVVFGKYLEPFLLSKQEHIEENVKFAMERAKNIKADDMTTFITWSSAKANDLVAAFSAAAPAAATAAAPAAKAAAPLKPAPATTASTTGGTGSTSPEGEKVEKQTDKPQEPNDAPEASAEEKKAQ